MSDSPPKPERETLRMPLRNFRFIGELTPEASEWFHSVGRHLEAARKTFDGERR